MVENFWNLNLIKYPSDIFNLNYKKISNLEGWGIQSTKKFKKMLSMLQKIYRLLDLYFSIGIRHIGQENAKILAQYFCLKK